MIEVSLIYMAIISLIGSLLEGSLSRIKYFDAGLGFIIYVIIYLEDISIRT